MNEFEFSEPKSGVDYEYIKFSVGSRFPRNETLDKEKLFADLASVIRKVMPNDTDVHLVEY